MRVIVIIDGRIPSVLEQQIRRTFPRAVFVARDVLNYPPRTVATFFNGVDFILYLNSSVAALFQRRRFASSPRRGRAQAAAGGSDSDSDSSSRKSFGSESSTPESSPPTSPTLHSMAHNPQHDHPSMADLLGPPITAEEILGGVFIPLGEGGDDEAWDEHYNTWGFDQMEDAPLPAAAAPGGDDGFDDAFYAEHLQRGSRRSSSPPFRLLADEQETLRSMSELLEMRHYRLRRRVLTLAQFQRAYPRFDDFLLMLFRVFRNISQ